MFLKNSLRRASKKEGRKSSRSSSAAPGMGAPVTSGNHKNTLKKPTGKISPQLGGVAGMLGAGASAADESTEVAKLTEELRNVLSEVAKVQQAP